MKNLLFIVLLVIIIIASGCVNRDLWTANCGGIQYDLNHQYCCGNSVYTYEEMKGFFCCGEDRKLYAEHPTPGSSFSCCGGQVYNLANQGCCNDKTVYDMTTQGCCNDKTVYSMANQHCCKGKVESGGGTWDECGDKCYSPNTQSCCYEDVNKTVHEGVDSCCVGKSLPKGYSCNTGSGSIYNKSEAATQLPYDYWTNYNIMHAGDQYRR